MSDGYISDGQLTVSSEYHLAGPARGRFNTVVQIGTLPSSYPHTNIMIAEPYNCCFRTILENKVLLQDLKQATVNGFSTTY